ncbi:MAG: spore maturation protein A [Ruminococcaceae bacterium]|nr:spore maturation protein A [Oscillospiraceae bacterium]
MVMSYVWFFMVLLSVVFSLLSGEGGKLSESLLSGAQSGITLAISIAGPMCLWSGLGKAMERSGLNRVVAKLSSPLVGRLFPSARKDETTAAYLCANLCANFLGLGNAATPMGIAATKRMASLAPKGEASHEMCRLIVMNTASIQLIPANVAAVRASLGCDSSFDILPAVWVTSLCSVAVGLLAARVFQGVRKDG